MTILPKKKVTKDKTQNEKAQSSHEHLPSQHHSQLPERTRHDASQIRSTAHSSAQLEERPHRNRIRHPPEFPVLQNTEAQEGPFGPTYDAAVTDSAGGGCGIVDPALQLHTIVAKTNTDITDAAPPVLNVQAPGETGVKERPVSVKRRHGRQSPHAPPYSRKNSRCSPTTDNASSSGMLAPPAKHHGAVRRHHAAPDDRRPISPPVNTGLSNASRSVR
uniref:Uncharacterized protein n=1 Tax=Ciona savignyi TaxID=51511 RepID=H2YY30_CIOSA